MICFHSKYNLVSGGTMILFFLALASSGISGCRNAPTNTVDTLNIDRNIPASANYDASYGFWGPEGNSIYYQHSEELGSNPDPGRLDELWKLNLQSGRRRMIHAGRILNADISPDGKWIVFNSFPIPQYLFKMRSDGSNMYKLTGPGSPNPDLKYTINGDWSLKENQILFSLSAGISRGVALMDSSGANPHIILPYGVEPDWTTDGNHIIYLNWDSAKVQKNQEQIYTAGAKGADPQRITDLTNTNFKINYPSYSPDKKRIAFTYHGEIYLMKGNGDNMEQVTAGPGYIARPVWSPDGKTILFTRIIQNVSQRLYYLNVATHQVTPVFPAKKDGSN